MACRPGTDSAEVKTVLLAGGVSIRYGAKQTSSHGQSGAVKKTCFGLSGAIGLRALV